MVRRSANEAIGDHVFESEGQPAGLEENVDTVCRGRVSLSDRPHAGRNEWAVLATIAFLSVWTARHIPAHGGHIAHLANRQPFCRRRGYQRRSNQPNDHKDREQTTDGSEKIHDSTSHKAGNFGRRTYFTCSPDSDPRQKKRRKRIRLTRKSERLIRHFPSRQSA